MNKKQWNVFGIGLILLAIFLFSMTTSCSVLLDDTLLISCFIRRYAFAIPAILSFALGLIFMVCGWLEKRKR